MEEKIKIFSHLIITEVKDDYRFNWCGKMIDSKPQLKNGKPIFIIVGKSGRMEINTTNMERIEKCAKMLTCPNGRSATTTDTARIFLKEIDGNEKLMGVLIHSHIKLYAPMYDKVYHT